MNARTLSARSSMDGNSRWCTRDTVTRRHHGLDRQPGGDATRRRGLRQPGGGGVMADEDEVFDMIVIGAGPVGITAAARAVRGGLTAAVIEERLAGGECEYYACVP